MSIVEIQGVTKRYANHTALDQVSFSVPKGKIFGLLGPNGAGKTSLIRIINQITAPDEGKVLFQGEELQPHHIKQIGYLPEERGLYKKMSVFDQLLYFAKLRGMNAVDASKTINEWLHKFEATSWKKKKIEELSKGMQQKIQFIVTVMHQPDFIILDEPFTGFDPKNTQLIKDEIQHLKEKGTSIMLSTHRMENVEEICDEVVLINNSKVVTQGSISDVRNSLKNNTYKISYTGSFKPDNCDFIKVQNESVSDGQRDMTFKYVDGLDDVHRFSNFDLKIEAYKEVIPSMQEVFLTLTESSDE